MALDLIKRSELARGLTNAEEDSNKTAIENAVNTLSTNLANAIAAAPEYSDGSWTPVISGDGGGSGQTYSVQVGRYIKTGKMVVAAFRITLSAKGTITGNAIITGLPFTVSSNNQAPCTFAFISNLAEAVVMLKGYANNAGTYIYLLHKTAAAVTDLFTTSAQLANNSRIDGTCVYFTD